LHQRRGDEFSARVTGARAEKIKRQQSASESPVNAWLGQVVRAIQFMHADPAIFRLDQPGELSGY
jgi:hypothetical protein